MISDNFIYRVKPYKLVKFGKMMGGKLFHHFEELT